LRLMESADNRGSRPVPPALHAGRRDPDYVRDHRTCKACRVPVDF
jgi:hypothetical protein